MGTIEATAAGSAVPAAQVPVDCFGERGMAHRPDRPHRMPIAAGLFGMPRLFAPRPSNDGAPYGRMTSAA